MVFETIRFGRSRIPPAVMVMADLSTYRKKRAFERTPEPSGAVDASPGEFPRFVVQEHAARRHHYDLRLEADGVLKSWAVPKGPSIDPSDKRLAVQTEDHPLEYLDFEGNIPKGEYGGGSMIVWDTGVYANLTERGGKPVPVADAVGRGHLVVLLRGEKLRGGYALQRLNDGKDWLLVKTRDDLAPTEDPVATRPESVLTGRTIADLQAEV
jgi:DNA ligase D-like protein (predicted 3'-phosphoesterase)